MTDKQIAEKIKEYRAKYNLTQEQLSRRLDIPTITLSRWERGKNMSNIYRKVLKQQGII
ncbi:MAG: helix-turn-helix transcriptional regulator [Candidatus Omnitrophica bacterium]|nr:helix-turn-helix transcriptional regulator [Candidatus Omnitrophota bacterium]